MKGIRHIHIECTDEEHAEMTRQKDMASKEKGEDQNWRKFILPKFGIAVEEN